MTMTFASLTGLILQLVIHPFAALAIDRRGEDVDVVREPCPRCSAASNALRRHRIELDLGPGLGVQEVGR
jgi:hypothetical protein